MKKVISVRFKENGKSYYFDPAGADIKTGEYVIVETARGVECGEVVQGVREIADAAVPKALKPITRMADSVDIRRMRQNREDEKRAYRTCQECIARHGLEMKLVEAEYTLDRSKIMFYFTADGRVDFRELVKDLASVFRTRIELRQIGVRDEAKMIGGLGTCGRELCCSSYLEDFHPVSINMAKDQNLSLNPAKISGTCGRLMCCLKYEHEAYAELQKVTPKQGSVVDTPEGRGKVISTQMLRGTCKVQLDDSPEHSLTEFQCADCCVVKGACRNRQNIAALAEERRRREEAESVRPPRAEQSAQPGKPERAPSAAEPAAPESASAAEGATGDAPKRRRRRGGRRRRKSSGGEAQAYHEEKPVEE